MAQRSTSKKQENELAQLQLASTEKKAISDDLKKVELVPETEDAPEDAPKPGTYIPLRDQKFLLSDEIAAIAMMEWAASGDADDMGISSLRAAYYVLQQLVHPDDWRRFKAYALENKLGFEELRKFEDLCFEARAANPTKQSES